MDWAYSDIPRAYTAIAEWAACLVFVFLLKKRHRRLKTGCFVVAFLIVQTVFLQLTRDVSLYLWFPVMVAAAVNMYLFIHICCNEMHTVLVYCTACAFLASEFASSLEWLLYYYFAYLRGISDEKLKFILLIAVYLIIFGCVLQTERQLLDRRTELLVSRKEMAAVLLVALTVFMFSNLSFVYPDTPFSSSFFYEGFKLRALINCSGLIILFAFQIHMKEILAVTELNAIQMAFRNQYNQYLQYQESMEMVNIKYHDLKHQIMGLRTESDEEKRKAWLDSMESEIDTYKNINLTGNKVLDAVLNGKIAAAKKYNINVTYVADGQLLDFMHVADLCTIFGNALDNAIEAEVLEEKQDQRLIHLSVSSKRQFVFIKIENYCSHELAVNGGMLKTTKANQKSHGYGLKSIRYSVEKYKGVMTIAQNNGWFVVNIVIPRT